MALAKEVHALLCCGYTEVVDADLSRYCESSDRFRPPGGSIHGSKGQQLNYSGRMTLSQGQLAEVLSSRSSINLHSVRSHELQETHSTVPQRLLNAKQYSVFTMSFRSTRSHHVS